MKIKLSVIILLIIASVLLYACSSASNLPFDQYLVRNSITLTCIMDVLAENNEFTALIPANKEVSELLAEIGADEYDAPEKAVLIQVSDEAAELLFEKMYGNLNFRGDAYDMFVSRFFKAMSNYATVFHGSNNNNAHAAASLLASEKIFPGHDDLTQITYVLLVYENRYSITYFEKSVNQAAAASSSFVLPFNDIDLIKAIAEETLEEFVMEKYNIDQINIGYISGESIASFK